tara:strand:+ start:393 stop:716 length:324 start_codon:yes stop_codon:yes gene_type:complete
VRQQHYEPERYWILDYLVYKVRALSIIMSSIVKKVERVVTASTIATPSLTITKPIVIQTMEKDTIIGTSRSYDEKQPVPSFFRSLSREVPKTSTDQSVCERLDFEKV